MSRVRVLDSTAVTPRPGTVSGLTVRPTIGPADGFELLEQAVLEVAPGGTGEVSVGEPEETLFVLSGNGALLTGRARHLLEPEAGVYLPPESRFELYAAGIEPLRVIAVRIPDPSPGPPTRVAVHHLGDSPLQPATSQREFRIICDPAGGLRSATHFVGYIPAQRAPEHFHTYDEVLYVLEGDGVLEAEGRSWPVSAGTCIALPARTPHVLANTGGAVMRVHGVFRPAGSPAAAFSPDGTPVFSPHGR